MENEILEIVDRTGKTTGTASRKDIHKDRLLHKVIHLLVFNSEGRLLLQKRSKYKDIEPGKWDTSVGGHILKGENIHAALFREMEEELGITECSEEFLYSYIHSGEMENELVYSFRCVHDGTLKFNETEIEEIRLWDMQEIIVDIDNDMFSEHFRDEFKRYLSWKDLTQS